MPADTPVPPQGIAGSMPGIQFIFATALPLSPEQITLYRLQLAAPVNADSARQVAEQWGMQNPTIYDTGSSESPDDLLLDASDGVNLMRFVNFADQFLYWPNYASVLDDNGPILPFDQQVAIATQYLQDLGVLNDPYRAVPVAEERSKVRFVQLLDGIPVIYSIGTNRGSSEWIDVAVDSAGQVTEVTYAQHDFQPIGQYPILTAQKAWQRFVSENTLQHANYAVLSPERPVTYQSWARNSAYQPGQAVDIYGYVNVTQPVIPGDSAWVSINNMSVNADANTFSSANPWDFIHLWGEIAQRDNGNLSVDMQGWEVSLLSDDILTGTIQRQGDQDLFSTKTGDYLLPDLPENYSDGALANVRGVIIQGSPPAIEWSNIDTGEIPFYYGGVMSCGGGGGGGGGGPEDANFGGGSMSGFNLTGETVVPTPVAGNPYTPGDSIEAVSGIPYIAIYQYASGLQEEKIYFSPDSNSGLAAEVGYSLEGVVLGGVLTPNLPVRIWGQVDRYESDTSTVVINVTRFEPVYPGVQLQQWAGTEEIANVEGQEVILFITTAGQTYVTSSSLQWPAQDLLMGRPGDLIGIEGYIIPDQLYGGYAVIKETGGEMPPDDVIQSAQPSVYDPSMFGEFDQSQFLVGQVTIENVELAYRSISLQRCTSDYANSQDSEQSLTVQPVWVFTGHFADGRQFQLQVQALPDEYLY
ncbi:MAG: hypothetical protein A2Z49_09100 [Chloroflexi bacterium RBG_19FT_COMBO_56_12]|nr:MAG: hypothetical protein A2Z49_09100 [Chloroflexi bacterium RBG_19FT_COMBO_56_12]